MNSEGFSPLHDRVLGIIFHLTDKHLKLGMENLFMCAELCFLFLTMLQQLMIYGLTIPNLGGVPLYVKQDEVNKKS